MPQAVWNAMPIWGLVATRAMLRWTLSDKSRDEVLSGVLNEIIATREFDLGPCAAIFNETPYGGRHKLLYHTQADWCTIPLEYDPQSGQAQPLCAEDRARSYLLPLIDRSSGAIFGSVLFLGKSRRRMDEERMAVLRLLICDLADIVLSRRRADADHQFADLVEISTDEIYLIDPDMLEIFRANGTATIKTGYREDQLIRMTPVSLKPDLTLDEYRILINPVISGREKFVTFETFHARRDGSQYRVTVKVISLRGEKGECLAEVVFDTTEEQRKMLGILQAAFEAFPGGIAVFDHRLDLMIANRHLYDLLDVSPDAFPPGASFENLIRINAERGEYGDGDIDALVLERVNHARLFLPHSFERVSAHGRVLSVRAEPLAAGGYILSYTDITVRKQAEIELIRHRDQLEDQVRERTLEIEAQAHALEVALNHEKQINALQRQFVSMTSHEFRTPLAIIDGAAQRLIRKRGAVNQEFLAEKTGQIRASVARMVELMESFLSAGRMTTGKIELNLADCSIKTLIEQAVERQREFSKRHRFHVDLQFLPDKIRCDPLGIGQAITNLLSNAVKYSPHAPDIEITGWDEGDYAVISFRDHGVGIDPDDLPKMFSLYFRARTSTGIAGTGIGLNLVKQIVDLHEGDIRVESERGDGSTFTLILPVHGPATKPQADRASAPIRPAQQEERISA
ncbi:sensor histidine kinase [Rhizobium sp. TRM95796]|uniref:sensor histidine kinase n=1 Tax=Rhizobium sp. TRM95796 TaxID=2979862 RepID=UPI0021E744CD|nr:PAS-domain containing protein [Rhizobium sp. TRM95796]MCV3766320.1 PAS-domain containing protein [Rhizobium sp. TRM95796]